jgi:hypothetical protein
MTAKEPRGRFSICKHKWIGWVMGSSMSYGPSGPRLEEAKAEFDKPQGRETAINKLHEITRDYPNTPAELEARKILKSIEP